MPKTSPTNPDRTVPISLPGGEFNMQTNTSFPTTHHAKARMQQRAISARAVELVCLFGKSFPAGDGCRRNILLETDAACLMGEGEPAHNIDQARRIAVITSEEGAIITCYAEGCRPALRCIRRKRKGPRGQRR
jgi:hypothetical protein